MSIRRFNCFFSVVFLTLGLVLSSKTTYAAAAPSTLPTIYQRADVLELMKRVMNFQIKAYEKAENKYPVNWQAGAFWAGVTGAFDATQDSAFHDAAKNLGEHADWKLNIGTRTFHVDSIAIGQAYLDLYLHDKDPQMIAPLKAHLEKFLDKKTIAKGEVGLAPGVEDGAPFSGRNVFWWCDALFMAPPVFAKMTAADGNPKWTELMHSLYWDSIALLYDPAEGLVYRDVRYFPDKKKTPSGKKIFWSRGNGWVYGGIIRTLDALPESDPQRAKYVNLFKQMTPAIVKYQAADGMWRPCINDPDWYPMPESSGSSFFCYGLLAGINRGILDRETYLPIALRAWAGLTSHVNQDGMLGYAQKEGAAPGETDGNTSRDYAQGAFLLAASELYKMNLTAQDLTRLKKPD